LEAPEKISKAKSAEELVRQIESEIMASGWHVGEVLGTFAELIARYGLGRAVVREAIGLLEHKQIVRMKLGPGGGIEVRAPVGQAVADSLANFFAFADVTDDEIEEVGRALIGLAARLATERVDEAGVVRLRDAIERELRVLDDPTIHLSEVIGLYGLIAELSENAAISLFLAALVGPKVSDVQMSRPPRADLDRLHQKHRDAVDAVISGDGSNAEALFMDATGTAADLMRKAAIGGLSGEVALHAEDSTLAPTITPGRGEKLPVKVARWIKQRIAEHGLRPGEVVGFERDMLDVFGVSRSVFREAVRVVEFYGIANMRRGPKGGLTVGELDASRMEKTTVSYLDFMGLDVQHLQEVRIAVELMNVQRVIERGNAGSIDLRAIGAGPISGDPPFRRFRLHCALAELSGNRASSFLTNVLTEVIDRRIEMGNPPRIRANAETHTVADVGRSGHLAIADAVIEGDIALARHRMLRHLEYFGVQIARLEASIRDEGDG
jgi:DNA-binding FadR family transcriptional regulator